MPGENVWCHGPDYLLQNGPRDGASEQALAYLTSGLAAGMVVISVHSPDALRTPIIDENAGIPTGVEHADD